MYIDMEVDRKCRMGAMAIVTEHSTEYRKKHMASPLSPKCAGQVGLLFPLAGVFVHFFGFPLAPKSAEQLLAGEAAFKACFTSGEGLGYCVGTVLGFIILLSFYSWVGKNSLAANWANTILALGFDVIAVVITAQYGLSNPWGLIIILGWTIFAVIGLYDVNSVSGQK